MSPRMVESSTGGMTMGGYMTFLEPLGQPSFAKVDARRTGPGSRVGRRIENTNRLGADFGDMWRIGPEGVRAIDISEARIPGQFSQGHGFASLGCALNR
jgi:hypothetical protein